jgi:hypothetical protein
MAESTVDVVLSWSRSDAGATVVLQRRDDGAWDEVGRTDATEFTVEGLSRDRTYVFAAAPLEADGDLAPEEEWETLRVAPMADAGTPALPEAPTGLAAAQDGANVNLRWDAAADGVTVAYELRVGAAWEDAARVAGDVTATTYAWPLDRLGRSSREAASVSVTIAPLESHETADSADQGAQGWPGPKTHLELDGGVLRLERLPLHFGAATAPFGSFAGVPCFAKYWPTGVYESLPFDAGQVEHQRVEVDLGVAQPVDANLPFGAIHRPAVSPDGFAAQNSWRVTPLVAADAAVEIDTSPTPAGPWDGWRPYAPGTYSFRSCRLRVTVTGDGLRFVRVPRLVLVRRKFNRKQEGHVVVNCSPIDLVFPTPFQNPPKVTATVLGYAGTAIVTNVTATGFTIAGGAAVFPGDPATFAPTVHWQALGT